MGSTWGDKGTASASPSLHDLITVADIHATNLSVTIHSTVTMNPSSTMSNSDTHDDGNALSGNIQNGMSSHEGTRRPSMHNVEGIEHISGARSTGSRGISEEIGEGTRRTKSSRNNISIGRPKVKASSRSQQTMSQTPSANPTDESQNVQTQPYNLSDSRFLAIQDNAVYLAVHGRYADGSFHCGLFIPILKGQNQGLGWYTNNAQGGWYVKLCSPIDVIFHRSLILLYKAGEVLGGKAASCTQRVKTLPADGSSTAVLRAADTATSARPMDTVTRVKHAILTLSDEDLIALTTPVQELEGRAFAIARQMEDGVKAGTLKAIVI